MQLSQTGICKLFDQCAQDSDPALAIEEVLSAYIAWKFARGQSWVLVLEKLRYLTIYLRVTNRHWVLEVGKDVFRVLALEITFGGGLVGACPARTQIGKDVFNDLRRKLSKKSYSFSTDPEYGGPITFHRPRFVDAPPRSVLQTQGLTRTRRFGRAVTASDQDTTTTSTLDPPISTIFSTGSAVASGTSGSNDPAPAPAPAPVPAAPLSLSEPQPSSVSRDASSQSHRDSNSNSSERQRWSERPRWLRVWFLTRPHLAGASRMLEMLVPEYVSLVPGYTSFRGTLPLYLSNHDCSRSSRN